jgi:hypothetical protein
MAVLAALGLAMLTGCEEKYQLTFVNGTQDQRSVELVMPGGGPMMIGTVDGMGDKARTSFKIESGDLPMTLKCRAGDVEGLIPLDSRTAHELSIYIDPKGIKVVDRKTEINTHEKSESTEKVHQGTVVK